MYKALIFDFDLTLVDSSAPIIECYKHTLGLFGYEVPEDIVIYNSIGLPLGDTLDLLSGETPNPKREIMREVYVKKADEIMAAGSMFYEGVPELLRGLKNMGIKTAIASSKLKFRIVETFEKQLGEVLVDEIVGLGDVDNAKPQPDALLLAAEKLGAERSEVLYVGDNKVDALAAQNAGFDFAAVLTGSTTVQKFEKLPHVCILNNAAELEKLILCK